MRYPKRDSNTTFGENDDTAQNGKAKEIYLYVFFCIIPRVGQIFVAYFTLLSLHFHNLFWITHLGS